jgi:hypothetical protein
MNLFRRVIAESDDRALAADLDAERSKRGP